MSVKLRSLSVNAGAGGLTVVECRTTAHLSRRRLTPRVRPCRRIAGADRLDPAMHDGLESHPHRGSVDRLAGWFKNHPSAMHLLFFAGLVPLVGVMLSPFVFETKVRQLA